jgi:hypothetical protein
VTHDTICEVNFGVSPITMYNIWCLLCYMLHKNSVLTLIWHLCNMWHNLMSNYNFNVIYATINTTHCNRWNHKVWYQLCHEPRAYSTRKTTICSSGCQVWNIVSGRSMTTFKTYCHSRLFIFTSFQGSLNEYIYIYYIYIYIYIYLLKSWEFFHTFDLIQTRLELIDDLILLWL